MPAKTFLDIGYFLLVESFVSAGAHFIDAQDAANRSLEQATGEPMPTALTEEQQNEQSLRRLQEMMANV